MEAGNLTFVNCSFRAVASNVVKLNSGSLNMTACSIENWGVTQKEASDDGCWEEFAVKFGSF